MYALVADVERYPEFIPWCVHSRLVERRDHAAGEVLIADVTAAFKMVRERFTSEVTLRPGDSAIDVRYVRGPFRHLKNHWVFIDQGDGTCIIDFYIEFEFRSRFLQGMISAVFHEAVRRMVHAFENRADALYGRDGSRQLGA